MINKSVARRYARALMELVEADAQVVADQLTQFDGLIQANPLLKEVLVSPAFRLEERKNVFSKVIAQLGWGPPLDRFLWYLIEHRRMVWLADITESFIEMLDKREGRVRVEVTSAIKLDKGTQTRLQKALAQGFGKTVVMESTVDSSLLAGVLVKVGDLIVDGTMKSQLDNLRYRLTHQQS